MTCDDKTSGKWAMVYYGVRLEMKVNEKMGRSRTYMYMYLPVFIDCNCSRVICAIVIIF
jgi:hypothetical protein